MSRIMFCGTGSGSGKTTITCGIIKALKNRKLNISAYKCGPDYIDSMYHRAIGVKSSNLDSFFCNRDELNYLLYNEDFSVIEGAMGFYDGLNFTTRASAWEISELTNTPVVLIVDCKGIGNSVVAILKGFLELNKNNIKGVIFNSVSKHTYEKLKEVVEKSLNIKALGYFPKNDNFKFESRHLGLKTPEDISEKLELLGKQAEESIDLEGIIEIGKGAEPIKECKITLNKSFNHIVALAYDEAFSFIYEDNIRLLEAYGCKIVYFSPLRDKKLPPCTRLILSGGYPELYGRELSENKELLADINNKISGGLKTIAECGGFIYLHSEMEDIEGNIYKMADVIKGRAFKTNRLGHFGYFNMVAKADNLICKGNEEVSVHEFHYWDSTSLGEDFILTKPTTQREHCSGNGTKNFYGGFPHIYFLGNRKAVERFLED